MAEAQIAKIILELGVVGLLFVMWWFERKDRMASEKNKDAEEKKKEKREELLEESVKMNGVLVDLVREQTSATVELRDEIARLRETMISICNQRATA